VEPAQIVVRGTGRETPLPVLEGTEDLVIDQAIVSATQVRAARLTLTNGAVLTHPGAGTTNEFRLEITVGELTVSTNSRIDVSERGYLAAQSSGNLGQIGRTLGNTSVGGSLRRNGGSYGGLGGFGSAEAFANEVYGSFRDPAEVGSGGGSDSGRAGPGGGLVRIVAQSVVLDGQILANGGSGSTFGGGGSGGGIKLATGTLTGTGVIHAYGGDAGSNSGGGGGGRVAIYHTNTSPFDFAQVQVVGGFLGLRQGTPGTLYIQSAAEPLGRLLVDALGTNISESFTPLLSLMGGANTALTGNTLTDTNASFVVGGLMGLRLKPNSDQPATFRIISNTANQLITDPQDGDLTAVATVGSRYSAELAVGHFALRGGAKVELADADQARSDRRGRLHSVSAELRENSVLSHPAARLESQFGLELVVDESLIVAQGSRIEASVRGYLGAQTGGNSGQIGRTLGNTTDGGSSRRNGGSYGGSGAFGSTGGTINALYGAESNPNEPGSGGGSDSGPAGSGGGLIRLQAATLELQGQILADGGNGSTFGGGGSGGAVRIVTRTLSGSGEVRVAGGNGGGGSGGGGGGRIAIDFESGADFTFAKVIAPGGSGLGFGTSGTLIFKEASYVPPAPVLLSTGRPFLIAIELVPRRQLTSVQRTEESSESEAVIRWEGLKNTSYQLETSTDLARWEPLSATIREYELGRYEARISSPSFPSVYFRLREVPVSATGTQSLETTGR